jgi:excisionase family DNA binding protein
MTPPGVEGTVLRNWNAMYMTDQPQDEQSRPLRFLTLQQVADELNTKHSTIRALIALGDLPAIQIGTNLEQYIPAAYACRPC